MKLESAKTKGETLIYVPCWWDGEENSIVEAVKFQRPDLLENKLPNHLFQIPLNPVQDYFNQTGVPGVGELMVASFPGSMKFHHSISSSSPWWVGEKYDGIRCCWNPYTEHLYQCEYSRYGFSLVIHPNFISLFPDLFCDGEIWFGRGNFPDTQRLVKSEINSISWDFVRVIVFDDAVPKTEEEEFEDRYTRLLSSIDFFHPFMTVAFRIFCTIKKQLVEFTHQILKGSGEGSILRKPRSFYEHGRSTSLLKIKASRADREAIVTAVNEGSYTLKLPDGTKFKIEEKAIGSEIRVLKRGDIVTFTYDSFSRSSRPVRPRISRIRTDLAWVEVVANYKRELAQTRDLNEASQKTVGFTKKPLGYWTVEQGKNMRMFFENFAKERNLDPLLPETWYSFSRKDIEEVKGGTSVLMRHKGGLIQTLINLFPDIGLQKDKFNHFPFQYWKDVNNRRKIFLDFAARKGFDALKAVHWYSQPRKHLLNIKGLNHVIPHYNRSIIQSLIHLFPEIGLDPNKFIVIRKWLDPKRRRKMFLDFAEYKGFDPLVAKNWYKVSIDDVNAFPGGPSVLVYHKRSLTRAITDLFPDINLDIRKFSIVPHNYWRDKKNRRQVFDDYAKEKGFNPLAVENWYSINTFKTFTMKGAASVLNYYEGRSIIKALVDVYPELSFDLSLFKLSSGKYWQDAKNRRNYFIEFAQYRQFDALIASNWYPISRDMILAYKGGEHVLEHHRGCHVAALMTLFPDIGLSVHLFISRPLRYWESAENRRKFFEKFAETKGLDPLVADSWYSLSKRELSHYKETEQIVTHHRGSWVQALMALFPDVPFDRDKFSILPRRYWLQIENRRNFFVSLAISKKFDKLDSSMWAQITPDDVLSRKGGNSILNHYNGSLAQGLKDVFPQIEIDESQFTIIPSNYLKDSGNRRKLMINFAKEKNFDALLPINWYMVKKDDVLSIKGIKNILTVNFKGDYGKMLLQIFPDIGLEYDKFPIRKSHWANIDNRREFFVQYAEEIGFDPLIAKNWYNQRDKFITKKGSAALLSYYDNKLQKALAHVFPDVAWQ